MTFTFAIPTSKDFNRFSFSAFLLLLFPLWILLLDVIQTKWKWYRFKTCHLWTFNRNWTNRRNNIIKYERKEKKNEMKEETTEKHIQVQSWIFTDCKYCECFRRYFLLFFSYVVLLSSHKHTQPDSVKQQQKKKTKWWRTTYFIQLHSRWFFSLLFPSEERNICFSLV